MAEGGKPQLAEVCSNLNCGICLERYKQPKILPCSHTFCLGCLEKTLKRKQERARSQLQEKQEKDVTVEAVGEQAESGQDEQVFINKIACPVCKREHAVPLGGLSLFPDDFEAEQAIEFEDLQKSLTQSKVSQKCASCKKERAITSHCEDCGGICQRCSDAHREFEIFYEHKVVPIDELTSDNFGIKKRKSHVCSRHGEIMKLYCDTCTQVICHVCIVNDHKRHAAILLEEADDKLKARVSQQREAAEQTRKVFEEYQKYIAGVEGKVVDERYNEKLRAKVNEEFDERIKRLQEKRRRLIDYIDGYDSFSKKQVWSEKETVELVLNKIQAGLKTVEKAQRCTNMADRIAMNSVGSKILEEVSEATWNHESLPHPLVFQKRSDQKECASIITSTDGQWSSSELAPITEKDIKICVVDENGSKVNNPKIGQQTIIEVTFQTCLVEEPKFQILYGKSRQLLNNVIEYEIPETKSWNIEFVPRCAGTHYVQVWVGGVAVAIKNDVTISGKPDVGSTVQPGPDWTPPNDGLLYLEGVVVAKASLHSVEVEWKKEESFAEEREHLSTLNTAVEEGEISMEEPATLGFPIDNREIECATELLPKTTEDVLLMEEEESSHPPEFDIEDYEPRSKHITKTYKWGGLSDKYEVELIL